VGLFITCNILHNQSLQGFHQSVPWVQNPQSAVFNSWKYYIPILWYIIWYGGNIILCLAPYLWTIGHPHAKITPNSANKLFTQLKATYTLSECNILVVISNHWYFLLIRHSGGFCGARCVFCTCFGREKVHFWSCPDRPLLQDISIVMLHNNAARSNLGQGYWESWWVGGTHTRDTGEKDINLSLYTCCEFQPGFCSQSCEVK